MFSLEPIPELSAFLLAVKMAKLTEGGVFDAAGTLEARCRATRSQDRAGWLALYRDALDLLPRVKDAQTGRDSKKSAGAAPGAMRQRLSTAGTGISSGLARAQQDWQPRLTTQERDVFQRAERAISTLPVESYVDAAVGELVFRYEPKAEADYWAWLGRAEKEWTTNNSALVAVRANEAILDALHDLPPEVHFRIEPARLEPAPFSPPRLRGQRMPSPGFFASLGSTYRFIMSAVTASSGLGFFASRVVVDVGKFLPPVLGAVFVVTVLVAIFTIPKERRQTMARLKARSTEGLERELRDAVKERLRTAAEAQGQAIRKHLTAETNRFKMLAREAAGSDPSSNGAFQGAGLGSATGGGLLPQDVQRLDRDWKIALSNKVATLEAELANPSAPDTAGMLAFGAGAAGAPRTPGAPGGGLGGLPPWTPPSFKKA